MNIVKKIIFLPLCILFFLVGCEANSTSSTPVYNEVNLAQYQGKWVFVNYWASWCKPCEREIPDLNRFYQTNVERVVVLGVNYDGVSREQLMKAVKRFEIQYPVVLSDPAVSFNTSGIEVLPTTLVFNPQGKLAVRLLGEQTRADLEKIIQNASK